MTYKSNAILKLDSNGAVRTWQFEVDGDKWRVITGGPGRKSVTTGWTTCRGKQGRSDVQQADFEANASLDQKLAREYRRTEAELASVPKGPMLAKTYEGWPKDEFVLFCQPKLDGIRALISEHGAFTREYQRHLNVDHIMEALAPAFEAYPGIQFDGELYNHDFKDDFGRISSIVRKQNPTPEQRAEARKYLQYHIYDICDDSLTFEDRASLIPKLLYKERFYTRVHAVPTQKVTGTDELDADYGRLLEAGYEGQMVRTNGLYEFDKRSKTLLKRKEFITAEFKLLRIEEGNGNWAGLAKRVVFELPDGRECGAGIRGTQHQARCLTAAWRLLPTSVGHDPDTYSVTIRHFTPTPDGMPRFPVAVDFHFGGRTD